MGVYYTYDRTARKAKLDYFYVGEQDDVESAGQYAKWTNLYNRVFLALSRGPDGFAIRDDL